MTLRNFKLQYLEFRQQQYSQMKSKNMLHQRSGVDSLNNAVMFPSDTLSMMLEMWQSKGENLLQTLETLVLTESYKLSFFCTRKLETNPQKRSHKLGTHIICAQFLSQVTLIKQHWLLFFFCQHHDKYSMS